MLEQRLIYLGNGRYQTASRSYLENANRTFIAYDRRTEELVERTAKSVRFTAVLADDMRELFDRVAHIICDKIMPGVEPDQLVEEAKSGGRRKEAA